MGFEGEGKGIEEGIEALKNGVIGLEIENLLEVTVQKKKIYGHKSHYSVLFGIPEEHLTELPIMD